MGAVCVVFDFEAVLLFLRIWLVLLVVAGKVWIANYSFLIPISACSNNKEAILWDLGDGEAGYLICGLGLLLVLCGDQKEQPGVGD